LLAEGAVIVVSILLAFAIDAWWDSAQERSKEDSYLRQLASDLEGTLANIERFGGRAEAIDPAAARLVQSYYEAEAPSRDSLAAWLSDTGYWVVQPRLGTVEALVTTGDLTLIRDDSLRTFIPNYLTNMTAFESFEAEGEQRYREASSRLATHIDPVRIRLETMSPAARDSLADFPGERDALYPLPVREPRTMPPLDLETIVRAPEVHSILLQMLQAKRQMKAYRTLMRTESETLVELVRSAQAR
jgi:hypothetical protein